LTGFRKRKLEKKIAYAEKKAERDLRLKVEERLHRQAEKREKVQKYREMLPGNYLKHDIEFGL
jgi:hypothetical protein